MEERKLNEHICADCGEKFYTYGNTRRRICDKCKIGNKKKYYKKYAETFKSVHKKEIKKKTKSLTEYIREVEEYNRSHNTCLTYGQYKNLTNKYKSDKIE